MGGRTIYYITEYTAGQTVDVQRTFSRRYGKYYSREKRQAVTPVAVEEHNRTLAERKLTRTINANFIHNDMHLVLTYERGKRPPPEEAKKQIKAFLRKLRRMFAKEGRELKYIWTTAYGERGGIHHHLIISTMDARKIRALWPYGGNHVTYLYDENDYSALASYFVRQAKAGLTEDERLGSRKWSGSRNLIIPPPRRREVTAATWREPPRPKPGYIIDLDSMDGGVNPVTGIPFLFYRMIRIPDKPVITTETGQVLKGDAARDYLTDQNLAKLKGWQPREGKVIKKEQPS